MTMPVLALVCPQCDWRPSEEITMALVAAHMQTEHGLAEDDDHFGLELRAFCPRDDHQFSAEAPDTFIRHLPNGKTRIDHTCPTCKRTYTVTQRKLEGR